MPGEVGSAITIDELLARLEAVRKKHVAADGLTSTQKTNLSTAYDTSKKGEVASVSHARKIQSDITNLSNSPYIGSYSIAIPSVGDIMTSL